MAEGNTSLDDCEALTSSLGWTFRPSRSDASVATTSLAFMFELVPEPVWNTSSGNWSSQRPSTTSCAAAAMASATSASMTPRSALARAAAPLMRASAATSERSRTTPETGKFSIARWVWAAHLAAAGTRTSPIVSCSMRNSPSWPGVVSVLTGPGLPHDHGRESSSRSGSTPARASPPTSGTPSAGSPAAAAASPAPPSLVAEGRDGVGSRGSGGGPQRGEDRDREGDQRRAGVGGPARGERGGVADQQRRHQGDRLQEDEAAADAQGDGDQGDRCRLGDDHAGEGGRFHAEGAEEAELLAALDADEQQRREDRHERHGQQPLLQRPERRELALGVVAGLGDDVRRGADRDRVVQAGRLDGVDEVGVRHARAG